MYRYVCIPTIGRKYYFLQIEFSSHAYRLYCLTLYYTVCSIWVHFGAIYIETYFRHLPYFCNRPIPQNNLTFMIYPGVYNVMYSYPGTRLVKGYAAVGR